MMSALQRIGQVYQNFLDKSVPYLIGRWVTFGLLIAAFIARIVYAQGWYIVTYGLFIYHLNLFLAFLTPKLDPAMSDDVGPTYPLGPLRYMVRSGFQQKVGPSLVVLLYAFVRLAAKLGSPHFEVPASF